jgi:cytochrome b subunit of formate dehydrogenase
MGRRREPERRATAGVVAGVALQLVVLAFLSGAARAADPPALPGSDDCAMCHEAGRMRASRTPDEPPPYGAAALRASPHADLECVSCHQDLAGAEFPHEPKLQKVECGSCHASEQREFAESLHGVALARGERLAPDCKKCHGRHDVMRPSQLDSPTSKVNVPLLCNRCHREGSPVNLIYNIPQDSILTNYRESIHGEALYRKGLLSTAVCTSCHTAHHVLPHTDPRSSIARANVAKTCTQCHVRIEQVHRQVIQGELWEKQPHTIPVCVDCHEPHKARRVFYSQGMADRDCMSCHARENLKAADGRDMHVSSDVLAGSRHSRIACSQCHTGGNPADKRPCRTMDAKVNCAICHDSVVETYKTSRHGTLAAEGSPDAPRCMDCHGTHGIKGHNDSTSPTYSQNIPNLCGDCHRLGHKAAVRYKGTETQPVESYIESIHGKGLLESGLTVTATCVDCHTAHGELPHTDPASTVNRKNIPQTCGQCHRGIYELFEGSIHATSKTDKELPVCSDCHSAHTIERTDRDDFRLTIYRQCGRCHEAVTESYFETFHGKVTKLGYEKTAKCYDCHGAHDILPTWDPRSHLSRENIVATCRNCHPGSNRRFAGYLTHATHHDPNKYPALFWVFWGMTGLLVGTFALAGAHTLAWLPRSLRYRRHLQQVLAREPSVHVRRFSKLQRNTHIMVIVSFIGLALTGMMLKFSYAGWAQWLSRVLGGFEAAGFIHRVCALLTFTYFAIHLWDLIRRKRASDMSWKTFITGPTGMMFSFTDLKEFAQSFRWFAGMGKRPNYGRWTYWEKFDYFAVFWGVAVIGTTGLLLWFPTLFTHVLPGWLINVATIIHSDEALLAVGFIFTVHFFNTHFRPEKFPMDTSIFTRGVPVEEFKEDRPREYEELASSGKLEERLEPAPSEARLRAWRIFGTIALSTGIALVLLILYSVIFGYR